MDRATLLVEVDRHFGTTSAGLAPWPDPHRDRRDPAPDEYSRVLDPGKYLLLGARIEAWALALVDRGLCVVAPEATAWTPHEGMVVSHRQTLRPAVAGALPLHVAHTRIGEMDGVGIVIGAGDPAVVAAQVPYCGCDACDDGSAPLLELLDDAVWSVVSGTFVRVGTAERCATSLDNGSWGAENLAESEVEVWLRDARAGVPTGRPTTHGLSWWSSNQATAQASTPG